MSDATMMCKKHGKPRNIVYNKTMPNGAKFPLVGCEDCRAGAARSSASKPVKKPVRPINLRAM